MLTARCNGASFSLPTRAGLSHMEFSNRSSLRTQGPQRERKALIAAARTLASALEQRPFFTFEARGYGSLRSQGRPAERLYEATTDQRGSIQSYAIALPTRGKTRSGSPQESLKSRS